MVSSHYKLVQPLKERRRWWWHHESRRKGWRGGKYSGETGGWWRWTRSLHRSGYAARFSTQVHFATSAVFSPVEGQRFHYRVWPCISVWPQTSFLERAFDYSRLTRMFVSNCFSVFKTCQIFRPFLFCKAECSLTIFCNVSFLLDNFYRVYTFALNSLFARQNRLRLEISFGSHLLGVGAWCPKCGCARGLKCGNLPKGCLCRQHSQMSRSTSKFLSLNEIPSSSVATSSYVVFPIEWFAACLLDPAVLRLQQDVIWSPSFTATLSRVGSAVLCGLMDTVTTRGHGLHAWKLLGFRLLAKYIGKI